MDNSFAMEIFDCRNDFVKEAQNFVSLPIANFREEHEHVSIFSVFHEYHKISFRYFVIDQFNYSFVFETLMNVNFFELLVEIFELDFF